MVLHEVFSLLAQTYCFHKVLSGWELEKKCLLSFKKSNVPFTCFFYLFRLPGHYLLFSTFAKDKETNRMEREKRGTQKEAEEEA